MRILGIDPGYAIVGYGVLDYVGNKFTPVEFGAITTDAGLDFPKRLKYIYDSLTNIINIHKPEYLSIEELFFNTNVKTAIAVGHARGVLVLAAENCGIPIYEYTPLQIKQAVTGYGRADKNQVQQMVKMFLGLQKVPKPDDTADALAVAICHAHSYRPKNVIGGTL